MTVCAPAAMALTISPEYLIPRRHDWNMEFVPDLVCIADRAHLWYTNPGNNSCRADRSRTDTHLNRINASFYQGPCSFRCRNISGDQFAFWEMRFRIANGNPAPRTSAHAKYRSRSHRHRPQAMHRSSLPGRVFPRLLQLLVAPWESLQARGYFLIFSMSLS